jgi:hypothetical protein
LLSGADKPQRTFILQEAQCGRLCGYTNKDEWGRAPKPQDPQVSAIAEWVVGALTTILVEVDTEDTSTYDEYTVDKDGSIRQLKRALDNVSVKSTREQIWDIRGGRATKTSESWMEFKTHKPLSPDRRLDELYELPIFVRMNDFPFYSLITDKHPEHWPGGKRCVPGTMRKLYARLPK